MMPLFLLNFFKGVTFRYVMMFVAAAALAFAVWLGIGFVNDKIETEREVIRLEQQIEEKNEVLRVLREAAVQRDSAIKVADATRAELEALQADYDAIVRDADTVKDEDNGEVAPVLRRTLDALGRM